MSPSSDSLFYKVNLRNYLIQNELGIEAYGSDYHLDGEKATNQLSLTETFYDEKKVQTLLSKCVQNKQLIFADFEICKTQTVCK